MSSSLRTKLVSLVSIRKKSYPIRALPFLNHPSPLFGPLFASINIRALSGSFRVLQRAALRATTAAPTFFKPVMMGGELYSDGGIIASNPTAVAIHEARTIFPEVPIELVVSCGTGGFVEEKTPPRIGWDGIIGQIGECGRTQKRASERESGGSRERNPSEMNRDPVSI